MQWRRVNLMLALKQWMEDKEVTIKFVSSIIKNPPTLHRRIFCFLKAFDDFVHIAFHNSFYVVEGFAEAVVGDSIFAKNCKSLFSPSGLERRFVASFRCSVGFALGWLATGQFGRQKSQRFLAVSLLGPLTSAFYRQSGRLMGDSDGRFHLVDILPAGSARAGESYLQILGLDSCFSSVLTGKTATEAVEVWTRPDFSVAGTRWTRCTPLSCFNLS